MINNKMYDSAPGGPASASVTRSASPVSEDVGCYI
jgi:hypothetical protein